MIALTSAELIATDLGRHGVSTPPMDNPVDVPSPFRDLRSSTVLAFTQVRTTMTATGAFRVSGSVNRESGCSAMQNGNVGLTSPARRRVSGASTKYQPQQCNRRANRVSGWCTSLLGGRTCPPDRGSRRSRLTRTDGRFGCASTRIAGSPHLPAAGRTFRCRDHSHRDAFAALTARQSSGFVRNASYSCDENGDVHWITVISS